ncbi:hypothetical protein [Gordonia polyisoprenivorans]|uniref:hypothetical protein n=1 Tax=Gordonia polyisoprenivorans TaxID=84595 RepID=UPI0012DC5F44|nr:hypothetical protein [Gordonia polyisoprenivorans]
MLAAVLVRRLTALPPHYVLPPLVGTDASASLYVVLCAASGGGKGSTSGVAAGLLPDELAVGALGSAEAVPKVFARRDKDSDQLVWHSRHYLGAFDEVSTLYANQARTTGSGDGLAGVLNSAWIGEQIGQMYSDRMKSVVLEPHSYRLGLLIGLQNRIAGQLLRTEVNGFAQRCLFVPANAGHVCPPARRPKFPGPLLLPELKPANVDGEDTTLGDRSEIQLPEEVREHIIDHDYRVTCGELSQEPLDAHRLLMQEKVATGFALLRKNSIGTDGKLTVTLDDWENSHFMLTLHDEMRDQLKVAAAEEAEASARSAGHLDGVRALAAERVVDNAYGPAHFADLLVDKLANRGPMSRKALRGTLRNDRRVHFDDAINLAISDGRVALDDGRFCATS